jgi:PAS domain S-box-containing protein
MKWIEAHGVASFEGDGENRRATNFVGTVADITERKRLEEELKKSEEESRLLIKYAPSMIYEIDFQGPRFISVNDAMCSILGYTHEELLSKNPLDLLENESREIFQDRIRKQLAREKLSDLIEYTGRAKDGRIVSCLLNISFTYKDGKPVGAVVIAHDITERKKAEEVLRLSEEKFSKAFYGNTAAMSITRLHDGLVIEANDRWCELVGFSREEAVGKTTRELNIWKNAEDRIQGARDLEQHGAIHNREYAFVRKSGEGWIGVISSQVSMLHSEKVVINSIVDITERKRAEEALQASEERYRHLVQHAPTGIYEIDYTTGRFMEVNDAMCLTLGYTRDEILAMTAFDIIDDEEKALFASRIRAGRSVEGPSEAVEYPVRTKDGRLIWALLNIMLHRTDGEVTKATVIAHDITERKRAEQALAERTAKLEEINKELESFSYSISHDLRAPLRAIDGYTRSILKKTGDKFDEETTRKFNNIRSNAQMMSKLIDDILTLSRLGRAKMSIVNLAMEGIINDVWKELQTINPGRNMTLTVQAMPSGYGDRTLIKQVYTNLLSNAVKFTLYKNPAQIEAGGYTDGKDHVYYVKDNGVGFDMAYYDKLFGIFQRLHNNPDFEGTGIGLATIQRAIHMHGGRVWAEGKVNEGATFYFTLPRS